MNCEEIDILLSDYQDNQSKSPEDKIKVEHHLSKCLNCHKKLELRRKKEQELRTGIKQSSQGHSIVITGDKNQVMIGKKNKINFGEELEKQIAQLMQGSVQRKINYRNFVLFLTILFVIPIGILLSKISFSWEKTVEESIHRKEREKITINSKQEPNEKESSNGRYTRYNNGIVLDNESSLEYLLGSDNDMNFSQARDWVKSLGSEWRLPTMHELKKLHLTKKEREKNDFKNFVFGEEAIFVINDGLRGDHKVYWSCDGDDGISISVVDFCYCYSMDYSGNSGKQNSKAHRVIAVRNHK